MTRPYRYWTLGERAFIRRHYGMFAPERLPTAQIAAALGRAEASIRGAAQRLGITWAYNPGPLKPRKLAKLARLYAAGLADGRIADEADCATQTVWRWRQRNGLPANRGPRGRREGKHHGDADSDHAGRRAHLAGASA